MVETHDLSHWTDKFSFDEFLACAETRPLGLKSEPEFHPLLKEIRALVPVPGDEYSKDIDVLIKPHQNNHQGQALHKHWQHTAIFYVNPSSAIAVIENGVERRIWPHRGEVVILPPDTEHYACPNDSDDIRLSFAMLVEPSIKRR